MPDFIKIDVEHVDEIVLLDMIRTVHLDFRKVPIKVADGSTFIYTFPRHSSGPFGDDLPTPGATSSTWPPSGCIATPCSAEAGSTFTPAESPDLKKKAE